MSTVVLTGCPSLVRRIAVSVGCARCPQARSDGRRGRWRSLPTFPCTPGERYAIVMRTAASRGAYGWAYDDADQYAGGEEWYAPAADAAWRTEPSRDLRYETL